MDLFLKARTKEITHTEVKFFRGEHRILHEFVSRIKVFHDILRSTRLFYCIQGKQKKIYI